MITDEPQPSPRPAPRHSFSRLTDPRILFPLIGVVLLGVVWFSTLSLIRSDYAAVRQNTATTTVELAYTYEAHVLRALREIDQTLKTIKYAYESGAGSDALTALGAQDLLPSDLLFIVSITDADGNIVASTRDLQGSNLAERDYFQSQRDVDQLAISAPQLQSETGEWLLHFSRRLEHRSESINEGSAFGGIVIVSLDPTYFVSSYDEAAMGERGALGILGSNGISKVLRVGENLSYGTGLDYAQTVDPDAEFDTQASVSVNPWDQQRRYTVARELFAFPLAILVGLSEQEQLRPADARRTSYLWRAAGTSLLSVLLLAILGSLSWQLQQSRARAMEEQMAHAKQVEYLAYHDGLTGLPNRSLFSKLLKQTISQSHRHDRRLSVLFLDLDRFKLINDTLGHDAGDELLIEVAHRLRSSLRESDTVARLAGDEFVVLLPELNEEKHLTEVANKILAAVRKPFALAGQEMRITVSIGISNYPEDGEDEQTLMKNADIAMYNAKEQGKNVFKFYSETLNSQSFERLTLEANLRRALENKEFRLHYQARKNIHSDRVTGVEALLRWQHPDLGLIAPKQFLQLAEESGLMAAIGRWILETACLQSVAWKQQGLVLNMAVNLSAVEFFDDQLLNSITDVLDKTGMDPHMLEVEVTESILMRDFERALKILNDLTSIGVHISIDNFGAGYSSLSTLKQLHLDTIKVDETFIRDITNNSEDKHLIDAIIAMARALGLTVVAGGVETREQLDFLNSKSCDEIQGFYFSEPIPADEVTTLLLANQSQASIES